MKKKIKLLLALVMSLTMVFGMSTTAFANGSIRFELTVDKDLFVPGKAWNDGMINLDYDGLDEDLSAFYMVDLTTGSQAFYIEKGHEYVYKLDAIPIVGREIPDNLEECFSCNLGFSSMSRSDVDLPEYGSRVVINLTTNVISLKDPSNDTAEQIAEQRAEEEQNVIEETIAAEEALPAASFASTEAVSSMPSAVKDAGASYNLSKITTVQGFTSAITKIANEVKAQNATNRTAAVTVYSDKPMTFTADMLNSMSATDVEISYIFRYNGKIYKITIPRGAKVDFGGSKYEGPLFIGRMLGTTSQITK